MANALSIGPLRALARRTARKIPDRAVAARFEALTLAQLLQDERNFQPASDWDIDRGPEWAQQARDRGEALHIAHPCRSASMRMHNVARRLADTCRVAQLSDAEHPREAGLISAARQFLQTLDRANFEVTARKALYFSRLLASWVDDLDSSPVCEEASVRATLGRSWRRITSLTQLRTAGRKFCNCLARQSRRTSYGGMLCSGAAQFWELRDAGGEGMMLAMAPAPLAAYFTEVRGPRNAHVSPDDADLRQLALAIGVKPRDPPPPPEPPAPARIAVWRRLANAPAPDLVAARVRLITQVRTHLLRSACAP